MTDREAAQEAELQALRVENKLLREKLDALIRSLYGSKSEKLDSRQLQLLQQAVEKNRGDSRQR